MNDNVVMPFGKHNGEVLSDIPLSYLRWVLEQEWLRGDLRKLIEEHLKTRVDIRPNRDER